MKISWIKILPHFMACWCVAMMGLCFGFCVYAITTLQILHLPTDTNEIVTVICVLGKCASLP